MRLRRPAGRDQRVRRRQLGRGDLPHGSRRGREAGGGYHRPAVPHAPRGADGVGRSRRGRPRPGGYRRGTGMGRAEPVYFRPEFRFHVLRQPGHSRRQDRRRAPYHERADRRQGKRDRVPLPPGPRGRRALQHAPPRGYKEVGHVRGRGAFTRGWRCRLRRGGPTVRLRLRPARNPSVEPERHRDCVRPRFPPSSHQTGAIGAEGRTERRVPARWNRSVHPARFTAAGSARGMARAHRGRGRMPLIARGARDGDVHAARGGPRGAGNHAGVGQGGDSSRVRGAAATGAKRSEVRRRRPRVLAAARRPGDG